MSEELSFRDRPINMDEKGRRKWIYAKKPRGKWFNYRTIVSWVWILMFVFLPIIKINGYPVMLLDIVHRKFIIFGAIFWAQDTFILALLMLSFVLFILLFTVTFGRIWCGWACPQTIFLEMIYRKIEYLIEGDYKDRHKLDEGSFNGKKIFKKVLKHIIFIVISILITNTFLMWFIGYDGLKELVQEPISDHTSGFVIMLIISGFFYWIYSFFREQICTMVCPYGRMQGVLLDSKSIIVAYDYKRGEPRGQKDGGDCVNCQQCVSVCPTGIDIRNGTQLECINCTACIDECNTVMKKVKKPEGLIRFDSIEGIEKGERKIWNTRNIAYSAVLLGILTFFVITLLSRPKLETTILRTPGLTYQEYDDGRVSNVYNIKIVNKTHDAINFEIKTLNIDAEIQMSGNKQVLEDQAMFESVFVLKLDKSKLKGRKTDIEFGIFDNGELIETYDVTFSGP